MADQHADVLNFAPPSLYSPSPARRGPRHFDVTWNQDDDMMNALSLCAKSGAPTRAACANIFASDITTKDSPSTGTLDRTKSANCA